MALSDPASGPPCGTNNERPYGIRHIRQALLIQKMDETADDPKGDQGPEAGHGDLEKNIFPMFTEPGSNESRSEQDK
jgi:hypothetical protein